jgi:hypothetical protein
MHKSIGVERCVIVHPPGHGTDLAVTIDAMEPSDREYRAVALVEPTITDERLEELNGLGFRGVRYSPTLDGGALGRPAVLEMARRIPPLGWHQLLHFKDTPSSSISIFWRRCQSRLSSTILAVSIPPLAAWIRAPSVSLLTILRRAMAGSKPRPSRKSLDRHTRLMTPWWSRQPL